MANPMDTVLSHRTSQERQPAAMPELPNNQITNLRFADNIDGLAGEGEELANLVEHLAQTLAA